ncbi:MAG TPA: PPE family protein, partial [Mycobacterium sp.]|nr:PPE family protein [Mycobacterium sp.]
SVASLASAREKRKARRRRGAAATERGYRDEYMTLDAEPPAPLSQPEPASTRASDHGAGVFGFSGTAAKEQAADAAGLATLADDTLGSGPSEPMLPSTWGEERPPERPK